MAINSTKMRYQGMSHTDGNTFGLEHGKIGDRIAVVLDGKQIYKKLYKPTNPRTPKQQMHRAKLAFVNRLSKELAEAVNLGFEMVPEKGSGQTARNAFVKMNWDNGSHLYRQCMCFRGRCGKIAMNAVSICPQMSAARRR